MTAATVGTVGWQEPEPIVIRDVFPAVVTLSSGVLRNARAVVTRERVYVWTRTAEPAVVSAYDPASSTVPRLNAPRSTRTALALEDGSTLTIDYQRGCGCGNPLKGWQPWRPYRTGVA